MSRMPKPARPPNNVKTAHSQALRLPRPYLMANMGPPLRSPYSSDLRKCIDSNTSVHLVAMPTSAILHIQNACPTRP
ncbi:hypothetical protein IWX85_000369 [Polaromonas sp. CG_9.11]|nr:hypothetical protein [Polaromonas sp. CG_9.11]